MENNTSVLNNMQLSVSSDIMRSAISWCRLVTSREECLSKGLHKHMIHELHYVYEGQLHFSFESGDDMVCGAGEYILIPPDVMHCINDTAPFTRKVCLGFEVFSEDENISSAFSQIRAPAIFSENQVFHHLAQALLSKFSANSGMSTSVSVSMVIHSLLLETAESLAAYQSTARNRLRQGQDAQVIDLILSYINANVFSNISTADVANAVNLSVRQTARICQRLFSCSINQLITQARLRRICVMLSDNKYSIAEVAQIAGFSSPYSFSRHFSHYTGVTPSAYRKHYELHR